MSIRLITNTRINILNKMNILLINDFLKISGGAEVSFTKTANLLRKKDHKVFLLGKKDNKESFSTFFSRWFSLR